MSVPATVRLPAAPALPALGVVGAVAAFALVAATVGLDVAGEGPLLRGDLLRGVVAGVAFGALGGLVAARRPRLSLGWLLLAVGLSSALATAAEAYARLALVDDPGALPGGGWAYWTAGWVWAPGYLLLPTVLLLLLPDGSPPSPRWRPLLALSWLVVLGGTAGWALTPYDRQDLPPAPEYGAITSPVTSPTGEVLLAAALPLLLVCAVGSLVSLAVRLRSARGERRDQLLWVLLAAVVVAALLGAGFALDDYTPGLVAAAMVPLPAAVAVAVLRHGLWDVDVLVHRSIVWGGLTILVLGVYGAAVVLLGALLGRATGGQDVVAFVVAAVAAQPLREALQRGANRLLYGDRDDPGAAVARLGERIGTATSATQVLPVVVDTVARTLRLPYAAVRLPGRAPVVHGTPVGHEVEVPLVHQGREVGTLVVTARARTERLGAREQRLLDQLAHHAALAAHAVALQEDLQRSREHLVVSREEERRRLRHDLHDDLGPGLAATAMQLETARDLVVADPAAALGVLDRAGEHLRACVGDVRRIVDDLRPPSLDGLGLVGALREQADRFDRPGLAVDVLVEEPLPELPAAVDVAAYRIAAEALANAARHAGASAVQLRLREEEGWLLVEVADDGAGIDGSAVAGVGLGSMHARAAELGGSCTLTSAPGAGTLVRARLPVVVA